MRVIRIDFAGKQKNPTVICILTGKKTQFKTVYSDEEILKISQVIDPDIITIDAPIMNGEPRIRKADKLLKKFKAFPPTLPGMKYLTKRGSKLALQFASQFIVIEVFPTATAKILGKYEKDFRQTAANFGIKVKNKDELDAYFMLFNWNDVP